MKFGLDVHRLCQISLLTFENWEVKINDQLDQGQNRHMENYPLARLWFKEDIFSKFGNPTEVLLTWNMRFDKTQDGGLTEVCTLWVVFLILLYTSLKVKDQSDGNSVNGQTPPNVIQVKNTVLWSSDAVWKTTSMTIL